MTLTIDNTPLSELLRRRRAEPSTARAPLPLLLSINEARRQLGNMSRAALYRLLKEEKLRSTKIGRKRLIFGDSVCTLIEESAHGE